MTKKFQLINRAELKAKLDNKEQFHLWNVLTPEFYVPGANIAGSKWIPVNTITAKLAHDKVALMGETIVVYCDGPTSMSSTQAAKKLQSLGYVNVFAYVGGLKDWSECGLALVKL